MTVQKWRGKELRPSGINAIVGFHARAHPIRDAGVDHWVRLRPQKRGESRSGRYHIRGKSEELPKPVKVRSRGCVQVTRTCIV